MNPRYWKTRCDFEELWLNLDKKLDLNGPLEVLKHLDGFEKCFDRDAKFFVWYELLRRRETVVAFG